MTEEQAQLVLRILAKLPTLFYTRERIKDPCRKKGEGKKRIVWSCRYCHAYADFPENVTHSERCIARDCSALKESLVSANEKGEV